LRSEAKEISRIYVANLQRDIVQLIDFLNEKRDGRTRQARDLGPTLEQMKEALDGISLKPEKGRRKDLRRIEQAIRTITKIAFSNRKTS
jgi:hypothetical protein